MRRRIDSTPIASRFEWTALLAAPARVGVSFQILAFIALLHIVGWGTMAFIVAPLHLSLDSKVFGVGAGVTAYLLGIRHAFDADHIAAIDNTTRKLLSEGKSGTAVGFWFSAGHSTIVFALTLLLSLGVHSLARHVRDPNSPLHTISRIVGTGVSGAFLLLIGVFNVVALVGLLKMYLRLRKGQYDEAALDSLQNSRGFVTRLLKPFMRIVRKPAQMYVVGLLFGLGFDTATEIALLVTTTSGAAAGLPWYATMCLPVLFAAGMLLFDTLEGSFMNAAYGWAIAEPTRKVFYNLVVTALSVAVALLIGSVELLQLYGDGRVQSGRLLTQIAALDLNQVGFAIVGMFLASWLMSVAVGRLSRAG